MIGGTEGNTQHSQSRSNDRLIDAKMRSYIGHLFYSYGCSRSRNGYCLLAEYVDEEMRDMVVSWIYFVTTWVTVTAVMPRLAPTGLQ